MPTFQSMKKGYANLWKKVIVRPSWGNCIDEAVSLIRAGRRQYLQVSKVTGVPWELIGVLHHMESGCNFRAHLHNGDSLKNRTRRVPKGRPKAPPANGKSYTWVESAVDALIIKNLHKIKDWTIERILYEAERFNGWGYLNKTNSPYLWSGTTLYVRGKYVKDHKYSSTVVSEQVGVVPLLKKLLRKGSSSMAFLSQFIGVAPLVVNRLNSSNESEHALALSVLKEPLDKAKNTDIATVDVVETVSALPISTLMSVLAEAEGTLSKIMNPTQATVEESTPPPTLAVPEEEPTVFDKLFGEKMTGWKTYASIAAYVVLHVLVLFGAMPDVLTPTTVSLIDTLLAGFGGASFISKIERFFKR